MKQYEFKKLQYQPGRDYVSEYQQLKSLYKEAVAGRYWQICRSATSLENEVYNFLNGRYENLESYQEGLLDYFGQEKCSRWLKMYFDNEKGIGIILREMVRFTGDKLKLDPLSQHEFRVMPYNKYQLAGQRLRLWAKLMATYEFFTELFEKDSENGEHFERLITTLFEELGYVPQSLRREPETNFEGSYGTRSPNSLQGTQWQQSLAIKYLLQEIDAEKREDRPSAKFLSFFSGGSEENLRKEKFPTHKEENRELENRIKDRERVADLFKSIGANKIEERIRGDIDRIK